jgi:ATP-binding cassette subfamily B protein AbcA/BmrA
VKIYKKNNTVKQMMRTSNIDDTKEVKSVWKPFVHMLKEVKLPYALLLLCITISLLQAQLLLLFPQYTEKIYAGNFNVSIAITAVGVVMGQSILTAVIEFFGSVTTAKTQRNFQRYFWRKLSRLPMSYYDKNEPRDLISRTTQDSSLLCDFFSFSIATAISSIYALVGSLVLLFGYDWRLAVSQIIALPASYFLGIVGGRISYKYQNRIQGNQSDLTRYLSAILPNLSLVKLFGQERREEQNGYDWIENYFTTSFHSSLAQTGIGIAKSIVKVLQGSIVILLGVYLVRRKVIDIGIWIAFYLYSQTLYANFNGLMSLWQRLKNCQGAARRISQATNAEVEEDNGKRQCEDIQCSIDFESVSFSYDNKKILDQLSFHVPAGKMTAIVGPSGAGKSTILTLLERFYNPDEGNIKLGGYDIKEYELHNWRKNISIVSQDTQLFSGTIRDNIIYGMDREVKEDELIEAAKKADALEFIKSFQLEFDTEVGENGSKLSGGQRQRIAVARAILRNTKVLLLDEITSDLDAEAEFKIDEAMNRLRENRTILIVAHRMKTIKKADQIIVLDKNGIQDFGTHEELIKRNSLYQHMVQLQKDKIAAQEVV